MRMIVEIETETWREGDVLRTRELGKRFKVGPVYVPRRVFGWLSKALYRRPRAS